MRIIKNKNVDELTKFAAEHIFEKLEELSKIKQIMLFGLVGGRSVSKIYDALSKKRSSVWKKTHFFLLDERYVPVTDKESNFKLIKESFLDILLEGKQITLENIHPINTTYKDPLDATKEYTKTFRKYGESVDVAIISSGEDGHVAGIFPNSDCEIKGDFMYFNDSPKPPSKRISITPSLLKKTDFAILIFLGKEKREALKYFLNSFDLSCPKKTMKAINDLNIITNIKGV